jgi:hypothetical protein
MRLARRCHCAYLRLDTLEQGLREVCGLAVEGEGYRLAYRLAGDLLDSGSRVVVDCCNPWELTRCEWEEVARRRGLPFADVEVVCSDPFEHRRRIETRTAKIPGLVLPTWEEVLARRYDPWSLPHLRLDTARRGIDACVDELVAKLQIGSVPAHDGEGMA